MPLDTPFDEEKEMDQNENLYDDANNDDNGNNSATIIVPNSDSEEEQQMNTSHNKPLKRPNRNRKRKRNEMHQDNIPLSTNVNLQNINISPIMSAKSHPKSKRRLNNGSYQVDKPRNSHRKSTQKQPRTESPKSPKSPTPGLFTDLLNTSTSKARTSSYRKSKRQDTNMDDKENRSNCSGKRNRRNSNPFSRNRKNHTVSRRSLAMIGAQNRPIDIIDDSDDDSVCEQDPEVQFIAIKKTPQKKPKRVRAHSFLSYSSPPNEDDAHTINNNNYSDGNKNRHQVCDIISDDEDNNDNDNDIRLYSQLSQSQSEKQIIDVMSQFQIQQKKDEEEVKENETTHDDEEESDDDDDDDIQVLSKPPPSPSKPKLSPSKSRIVTMKKKDIKPKKFTPKPFKPPKFKNGTSPKYTRSSKKKKNINKQKAKPKSKKFKVPRQKITKTSKNQTKLTSYFSKK